MINSLIGFSCTGSSARLEGLALDTDSFQPGGGQVPPGSIKRMLLTRSTIVKKNGFFIKDLPKRTSVHISSVAVTINVTILMFIYAPLTLPRLLTEYITVNCSACSEIENYRP